MGEKIRVLVADDSAFARRLITDAIARAPEFEIAGYATTGKEAVAMARTLHPDIITMDIQMPELDGYQATQQIMAEAPTAIVVLSTLTEKGTQVVIQALEAGAVDCLGKPHDPTDLRRWQEELVLRLKAAAMVKFGSRRRPSYERNVSRAEGKKRLEEKVLPEGHRLVAIGASTGGPRALQEILPRLPKDFPAPVVVVQHMPAGFTRTMAERLDSISNLRVKEAEDGEKLQPGKILIAPGDFHLRVNKREEVVLSQDPPIGVLRPAVDVTFLSVAEVYGPRSVGVILTGMGSDGTKGAAAIKQKGGIIIAEDESTCVVYGMPRSVVEQGYADAVLPLTDIPEAIMKLIMAKKD